jgi:hypothetical protein
VLAKLKALEEQYDRLAALMADPSVASDPAKYREHAQTQPRSRPS